MVLGGLWVCRVSDWQRFIGCLVGRGFVVLGRQVLFFVDYSMIHSILCFLYVRGSWAFDLVLCWRAVYV